MEHATEAGRGDRARVVRLLPALVLSLVGCVALGLAPADYRPQIDPARFRAPVDNPYYPLAPGSIRRYVERTRGETSETVITVTDERRLILGVQCTVVHGVVTTAGRVREDTYDFLAADDRGAVWYFGAETQEISAGGLVDTSDSWEAGVRGAQPGILMPANPAPGEPYRQNYALQVAEDMAQVEGVGEAVSVPAGRFTDCVRTKEWSELEAGSDRKWYARGVGLVRSESTTGEVEALVSIARE